MASGPRAPRGSKSCLAHERPSGPRKSPSLGHLLTPVIDGLVPEEGREEALPGPTAISSPLGCQVAPRGRPTHLQGAGKEAPRAKSARERAPGWTDGLRSYSPQNPFPKVQQQSSGEGRGLCHTLGPCQSTGGTEPPSSHLVLSKAQGPAWDDIEILTREP